MLQSQRIRSIVLLVLFSISWTVNCSANDRQQLQRTLNSYCVSCHGADNSEAGLRLDQMAVEKWNDAELLNDIYTVIDLGEMPPEDAPKHPGAKQIQALQKILGRQLQALAETQRPGMLKRLSRIEYQNTINDVFGTEFSLLDRLPLDNIDGGFNNNADNLHMSLVDMETYFSIANMIAENVVSDKPAPRDVVYSTKHTDIDSLSHKDNTDGFAPSLAGNTRPLVFASPSIQIKINPSIKTSGVYRIVPQGFFITAEYVRGSREAERLPAVKDMSDRSPEPESAFSHSMSYFLRKNSGVGQSIVTVVPQNAAWKEFDPREGFTTRLESDDTIVIRCNSVTGGGRQPMFCIEHAIVTGPVYESWPPNTPFYNNYCKDIDASSNYESSRVVLKQIAEKLFRRPVTDGELQQIYGFAEAEFGQSGSIYSCLQAGIRGMLCSPNFLYKQEGASGVLDDYAIASRMSYFLWNSLPDDTLFELARQGKLEDPQVRSEQTIRMLQDAKSQRFAKDYVYQWLDLEKLEIVEPDVSIFNVEEFDLVRDQIKEEPVEFFKEVLTSNLSLFNFIDSEFVMITPELNYIYRVEGHAIANPSKRPGSTKISPVDYGPKEITSKFSKVMLSEKDRLRGGLLTQAGFMLMTTNNGEYTNPFYRGAWVLKSFYGDPLETPADLEISALSPPTTTATIKQTIDAHRENTSCNSCHRKMDPLGIALENFDVMGRWRDQYTDVVNYNLSSNSSGEKAESFPVDAKTVHMDGREFSGPQGLKKILLEDKDKFSRVFSENLLSYGLARQLTFQDRDTLTLLHEQAAEADYRLRDIMLAIISSEYFTRR